MPTTTGMRGAGFYDEHSTAQWSAIAALADWLDAAVAPLPLERFDGPLSLVDVGCSEGRNSIRLMNGLVGQLRKRTAAPLRVAFCDLPTNDFNQFHRNLAAHGGELHAAGVFPATVAGSMFEQLLPAASVHLACTFNTIAYLDRLPDARLPNYILPNGPGFPRAGVSVTDAERAPFEQQAAHDLKRFFDARARELVPGGKLVAACFGIGERFRECDGLVDVLNDALLDALEAGRLAREAYERFLIPCYCRTVDELVAGAGDAFEVDRAGEVDAPVPFQRDFAETGDVEKLARAYTGFLQAFAEPLLRDAARVPPGGSPLVDYVFGRVAERIRAEPTKYAFHYIETAVLLTRR